MKSRMIFYTIGVILILITYISYTVKIYTGKNCNELPIIYWKFAIYTKECTEKDVYHFQKMEETGMLEYFGLKKIFCVFKNEKKIFKSPLQDTTSVNSKRFIREYATDSLEIYDSKYENINGCQKIVESKTYDKHYNLKSEWIKKYRIDNTQTCDFSAYTIIKKKYKNGKISQIEEYFAGSDESEEEPCGVWEYYTNNNQIKTKKFIKCDLTKFGRN